MKRPKLQKMIHAIIDKRLYGFSFFLLSGPLLAVGFVIEVLIEYTLNRAMLLFYVPIFIALVLVSGLGSKNYGQEIPNMGHFRGFLFLIASVLAVPLPFLLRFPNDLNGLFQFSLTFAISTLALTIAIIEVTVFGQRVSLRNKIGLTDDFFKNQKKVWKKNLEDFPNSEKIITCIEDGRFVAALFDRGSFNLTILWSCNAMEKIVDAVAEEITLKTPERKALFRKLDNSRLGYPKQLENLGFKPQVENSRKDEQISMEVLWHEIRRDIAHKNYKPTFQQTSGAICILVSFMKEMPEILEPWK